MERSPDIMSLLDAAREFPSVFDAVDAAAEPTPTATEAVTSFAALGVPAPLVRALAQTGITAPFPIQ